MVIADAPQTWQNNVALWIEPEHDAALGSWDAVQLESNARPEKGL